MATWTSLTYAFGSKLTSAKMTQNQDNFLALAEGASSAPAIQLAAMDTDSIDTDQIVADAVTQDKVDSAAIGQSQCKTTTGEVSANNTSGEYTLPGGSYGFHAQIKYLGNNNAFARFASSPILSTSYVTEINLDSTAGGGTIYAQQRYFQASPPYDLGDGEIPLFIFCKINKGTGRIEGIYSAPEAPWHYNGPTKISAEYYKEGKPYKKIKIVDPKKFDIDEIVTQEIEITQDLKNADMNLIPHPFLNTGSTHTVVLLDPVSDILWKMKEAFNDLTDVHDLLYNGDLRIDNTILNRIAPITCHEVKWK